MKNKSITLFAKTFVIIVFIYVNSYEKEEQKVKAPLGHVILNATTTANELSSNILTEAKYVAGEKKHDDIELARNDINIPHFVESVQTYAKAGFIRTAEDYNPEKCDSCDIIRVKYEEKDVLDTVFILDISDSLIKYILSYNSDNKFICHEVKMEMKRAKGAYCLIQTDFVLISYFEKIVDKPFRYCTGLRITSGEINIFTNKIKVGMKWEEFLKAIGMDLKYHESKFYHFRLEVTPEEDLYLYFANNTLLEIIYIAELS
ncbi:MAG: hypothetical protein FWB90_00215 [Fibromonadales bacterium]|nr:hypothetical protein [Fibromonadales bacterium]